MIYRSNTGKLITICREDYTNDNAFYKEIMKIVSNEKKNIIKNNPKDFASLREISKIVKIS